MAKAIREVVATAILFEVADPRVRSVTVLGVEVSGDLRHAKVQVSVMGAEAEQQRALEGLNRAAGFLQSRVAARLQTRFTPILSFTLDDSVKKSIELGRLIDEAIASDRRGGSSPNDSTSTAPAATETAARGPTGEEADLENS
jgi:ribosome-binding factor A